MIDKHSPMAQRHVVLTFILATSTLISANQSFESDHSSHLRSASRQLMSLASFHDPATIVRKGEQCTLINNLGVKVLAQPGVEPATMRAQVASQTLLDQLHLDIHTNRPIWTSGIIAELDKIVASGGSISCSHYPHSAEDVGLAVQKIGLDMKHSKVGVVSSISPWVEHVLRSHGASHVITIDYNEPIVCSGIEWIESKSVPSFGDEVGTYDLLVSFSGIEHSGLGRYGDPINPNGDLEAMQQIHRALVPGGYLLLAIPTGDNDYIEGGNAHRIYGPDRMAQMLEHFEFIGRVWDGQVFGGWEDVDSTPRLFSTGHEIIPLPFWQFQNVLILRKMG